MSTVMTIPCPKCGKGLKVRDRNLLGKKGRCPGCQHAFVLTEPEEVELELADAGTAVGTQARWVPDGQGAGSRTAAASPAVPVLAEDGGTKRLKDLKRKNAKRRRTSIVLGGVVGLLIAGTAFGIYRFGPKEAPKVDNKPKKDVAYQEEKASLKEVVEQAKVTSPTQGKPIELLMVPLGARVIVNLRPAELWAKGSAGEEFRFCLGPVAQWAEEKIKQLTLFEPAEISELLICVIPRSPGEAPDVAGVVHLAAEHKRSEMIAKFQGEPNRDAGYPVYIGPQWAYMIGEDPKTFAFGPSSMAKEMADAVKFPNPTDPGIEELLQQTDRERHLTVMFRPDDARVHHKDLLPDSVGPLMNQLIDWFNPDEVETVAWSMHLAEKRYHSDFLVRNKPTRPTAIMQRDFRKKLDRLPADLMYAVQMMDPKEAGKRQIIGRFPAMMKVFGGETTNGIADRYVQLTTVLPERAGPNIAIGSLLAWDESTRTDFNKKPTPGGTKPGSTSAGGAETQVAKLGKQIEIDFRKTPLQDAFKYIADETGATIDVDGDGLKLSGYTKNMEQNMNLGKTTGMKTIAEIMKKYKDMCLLIDEEKKICTVTTKAVAEKLGKKPYDVNK